MSTDYYVGCDRCKKYTAIFYRQAWGVHNSPEMMLSSAKFIADHVLECGENSVRIEAEQGRFFDEYDQIVCYIEHSDRMDYLDELPVVWDKYCKEIDEKEENKEQ
jgi:hypothetical protein